MNKWFENNEGKTTGLVLGGGGARGCYEIGVWKALNEEEIVFDCTAGTSIGALVGAIYVQQTLERILCFVEDLHPQAIARDLFSFPEDLGDVIRNHREISGFLEKYILSNKGMDIEPLKTAIHNMFDYRLFHESKINYACMTFNVTKRKPEAYFKNEMTSENAEDIILASASCYPAFPVMKMNGNEYIDGGYWNNVPIDLAMKMGAEKILAIDVQGPGVVHPIPKKADVFYIRPMLPLGNFLDFSSEQGVRSLQIGYLEALRLLGRYFGYLYTFVRASEDSLRFLDGYLSFMFMMIHRPVSLKQSMDIAKKFVGFTSSDLSENCTDGYTYGILAETLAYISGIEPVAVYTAPEFIRELFLQLNAIAIEKMPDRPDEAMKLLGSLGHDRLTAVFHHMLNAAGGTETDALRTLARVFPDEMILAWVWYFLGEVYQDVINTGTAGSSERPKGDGRSAENAVPAQSGSSGSEKKQ